jgi:hypothetical protein
MEETFDKLATFYILTDAGAAIVMAADDAWYCELGVLLGLTSAADPNNYVCMLDRYLRFSGTW